MNISYKREMRHNYLILEAEAEEDESFEIRMLTGNTIEGLLKFRIKQEEQGRYYYYEITSKQPLSRLLEFKEIKKEELSRLMVEIGAVLNRMEDYLLSEANIFLEPEHIYIEPEFYRVWLCYVPGYQKSFPEAMEKLLQYLLKKTDHKDNDTVVLAYRLYQESQKDYYGIDDLLRIVRESQQGKLKELSSPKDKKEEKTGEDGAASEEKYDVDESIVEEEDGDISGYSPADHGKIKVFAGVGAVILLGPVFLWLFMGTAGLWQHKVELIAVDAVTSAGALAYLLLTKGKKKGKKKAKFPLNYSLDEAERTQKTVNEWQMNFEQEEDEETAAEEEKKTLNRGAVDTLWADKKGEEKDRPDEENTVLLAETSAENQSLHMLKSVNPSINDIPVPYFPFIIGKQEGIVDYVLNKDTVSRIHLRIDEEDGQYKVMDLNSSNGTMVNHYRLDANESCLLSSGDKLIIAELSFVFY